EVGESRRSAPIGHVQHACARHLLNNSQKMCDVEPTPADATVRASGLAFAAAISSGTDCTENAGCTTSRIYSPAGWGGRLIFENADDRCVVLSALWIGLLRRVVGFQDGSTGAATAPAFTVLRD